MREMRDRMKRIVAVLLAIALTLSNFPQSLFTMNTGTSDLATVTVDAETDGDTGGVSTSSNDVDETEAETESETETEAETEAGETVSSTSTDKLQTLIDAASSGDTIQLEYDYTEDIEIGDGVNVTIDLNGHTITSAGTNKNAVMVYGTLTLTDSSEGGTGALKNGDGVTARGVDVAQGGSFTLTGGTISGFSANGNGGGVLVENGASLTMTGGTISGNTASSYGGGVFIYDANLIASMTGGIISGNTAGISGGGLASTTASKSEMTLQSGLTISGNTAGAYGGGVYFNSVLTTLTISSTISGNTSTSEGGGVYFGAAVTTLNMVDATIDDNISGAAGGGAYFAVAVTSATISGSSLSGNQAAGNGGGIWLNAGTSLTLEDSENNTSRINDNTISAEGALFGGGIFLYSTSSNRSTFTSTGGEISGNTIDSTDLTNSYGGGICIGSTAANAYASVNMSNTTVSNNSGATYGGGIAIYTYAQEATFTDVTISGNAAVASATANTGIGGGFWIGGSSACEITVSGGTYSENTADYCGGAVYVSTAASSLVLKDAVKIDGNTAYNNGGGIYTEGKLTLTGGESEDTAIWISNNTSTGGQGGGAHANTSTSTALVATGYVNVYKNSAGTNGGGLSVGSGGMDLSGNIKIYENYAKGSNYGGGGLYASSNTAGTIYLHDGVEICDNTCGLHGGGVYGRYEVKIADGAKIHDNYATNSGGGVAALQLTMEGGEIYDNSAASGGGIYDAYGNSEATNLESHISGGKIYNNTARTGSGGGIYANSYINILYIDDVEIYDNTAYSYGGGIYWTDLIYFNGGTVTGNTAQRGGGIYIVGYGGQSATIEIADGKSGIIYDNTATAVNYGNDLALGYNSTSVNNSGTYNGSGETYAVMKVGAANTFKDTANDITGVSWYDEVGDTTTDEEISASSTSSTQSAGQYFTLVYEKTETAVAEIWNTTLNSGSGGYETFTSVQAAVDAVADATESKYGTENGADDTITIIMLTDSREDVTIPKGVSVTLDLAGCTLTGLKKSVITVDSGATLVIDDSSEKGTGLITGGDGTYWLYNGSSPSYCGGGLFVSGSATLKGGTISGNTTAYGGGVYVASGGTFTLSGGTIASNASSSGAGGGIYVVSGYTSGNYKTSTPNFTMTSGSITGNTAGSGAGIYTLSNYTNIEISGGSITGNTATSNGGGVCFNGSSVVTVKDVEITGNTALSGGGLYINNASSSLTVSEAAKIYENTATSNSGNDIYAKVKSGSINILAAASMGNDAYNSWFDSNGDDNTYLNYYTDSIDKNSLSEQHIFALTATYYSGGYVAYIPETTSGNTVYQIASDDGNGGTTYSYTMDSSAASGSSTYASGTAYSTLQGAINAAGNGDTIYLLSDVYESVSVTGVAGREGLTIDLNGYTLYSTGEYGVYIAYANSVSMTLNIQSTNTDDFANSETDATGTITKAASNLSDFPRGIYMASGNNTYETYLVIDSVVITGFGNETYASEGYSSTYAGGAIYASSYNSVTLTGNTKITDSYAYQGGGIYMTGYNTSLKVGDDVVVSNNKAYYGGGIYFNASGPSSYDYTETLTIGKATISGNSATSRGGGIYVYGWNNVENTSDGSWPGVTMTGTTITGNTATTDGAGAYLIYVTNLTIDECTITDNASSGNCGGMYITTGSNTTGNGNAVIKDSEFTGNAAATSFAGLAVTYGVVEISGCTFEENKASTNASALYISTVLSDSKVENCTFIKNETTTSGNVINIASSTVDVSNVVVTGNTTAASVGAVYAVGGSSSVQGNVTFTGCDFSSNSGYGLELLLQGAGGEVVTVKETTIEENNGYGIYMRVTNSLYNYRDSYILNIEDGTEIANNGNTGIYANGYGTININGGKIYGNTGATYGGGVYAQYTDFHMTGGEIYNNTAPRGGGVYLVERTETYTGGTVSSVTYGVAATDTITGGKIYNNTATSTGDAGGGIYVGNYDKLVMTGGTVTNNTASGQGGGVYVASNYAAFELGTGTDTDGEATVGQIYDNTATLGQDVYASYSSSYANTSLVLVQASDMFSDSDGKTGVGWLNESTSAVTTTSIEYSTVKKIYPLTLQYDTDTTVAVIWNVSTESYQEFTSVQEAVDALQTYSSYYYTTDITSPEIILVDDAIGNVEIYGGQTLTINLNGYTLKGNTTAITCYGTLTIKDVQYETGDDSTGSTYCAHYDKLVEVNQTVQNDASLGAGAGSASTGTITGAAAINGGGVAVYSGGSVTMTSGQIANCTAGGTNNGGSYGGAGVYVENGTFVLGGAASINNCSTLAYGAAVYVSGVSGSFTLQDDAVIESNSSRGGAVYLTSGTFKMTGGAICDNAATLYGGGIYVASGTATISAGEITGNTSAGRGGAIYLSSGTLTLTGKASVTNNSATTSSTTDVLSGAGGAIYMNSGTLNIKTGAEITGNSAIRGGAIYQYGGTIKMAGGQITGNVAEYGGGLVQYPTQAGVFTMTGGVLCDNTSNLSSAGNDVYSISESGYTYTGSSYPTATLIRAADMDYTDENYSASYNVWKDDTYTGDVRTGTIIGSGQYITTSISSSTGLQLTAEKYGETTATETASSTFYVKTLALKEIADGTSTWDSEATGAVTAYKDATTGETTSETWSSTSAINPLAAEWTAGNDSNAQNGLVRSYDTIKYDFTVYIEDSSSSSTDDGEEDDGGTEGDSGSTSTSTTTDETVLVYLEVTIPLSTDYVDYNTSELDYYEVIESDDGESQTIRGYLEAAAVAGTQSVSITLNVKGMTNGSLVKPTFNAWIDGNSDNEDDPATITPTAITVSATGMYDLTLLRNSELAYTGYFDLTTGEETTKEAYVNCTDGTIVYGTMLGYGITLSMRNSTTGKGKKGMENPTGDIEFDLTLTGSLYLDGTALTDSDGNQVYSAPYVWAYKANANTSTGSSLNNTLKSVDMNWNDDDDVSSTTQYAYNAAPFNTGGNNTSCYSGGAWTATGSQPGSGATETTVHFSVSGYTIDPSASSSNPNAASDGTTTNFTGTYIKAFSAGYIQVIFPIDTTAVSGSSGYLSIGMESIVSDLDISDSKGTAVGIDTSDSESAEVSAFVDWYGTDEYTKHATCEVTYKNNYHSEVTGLYVSSAGGESLIKTNYFRDSSISSITAKDEYGTGTTALNSVVYMSSDVTFSSNSYDTTDKTSERYNEEYDIQEDNAIEYDYLTALNILEKFDADAYTPASTTLEIVNKDYTLTSASNTITDDSGNTIFKISSTETVASWSNTKTYSYTLTILYAAKTDGENWVYSADTGDKGYKTPVGEMDETTEEDLIYFTTLQDLYDYFGYDENGDPNGVCVGILYEFRDCCVRDGRKLSVYARMNVSDDFEDTGKTYCKTNDVRGWTTYRPEYKTAFTAGKLSAQLFNFSWTSEVYDDTKVEGVIAYGTATGYYPSSYDTAYSSYSSASGGYSYDGKAKIETYNNGYVQTQYEDGYVDGTTHSGWYSGNTLLLYTMTSDITIVVTDKQDNSNLAKTTYSLGSERTASFQVTPTIAVSSGVSNELVTNGTQSTVVVITINLPNHLNYDDGSLTFDYSNSGYTETDLAWNIVYTESEEKDSSKSGYGTATLVLTTTVTDISKALPLINYTCTIGKPGATKDDVDEASNNENLTTTVSIETSYEETGQISTYSKEASVTIKVSKIDADAIWIEASGKLELGQDLEYNLYYRNSSQDGPESVEVGDVLPYVGDTRGTSFSGGYQVTGITLTFSDYTTYSNFCQYGAIIFKAGETYKSDSDTQLAIFNNMLTEGTILYKTSGFESDITPSSGTLTTTSWVSDVTATEKGDQGSSEWSVTLDLSKLTTEQKEALTQLSSTGTGIAFYIYLKNVQDGGKQVQMTFTLSPYTTETTTSQPTQQVLLMAAANGQEETTTPISDDDGETQEGGDVYKNNLFYKKAGGNSVQSSLISNTKAITVIERNIYGITWLDMDEDGVYSDAEGSTDELLSGIDVYLYSTTETENQEFYNSNVITAITDPSSGVTTYTQNITYEDENGSKVVDAISLSSITLYEDDGNGNGGTTSVTLYPVVDVWGNLVNYTETSETDGSYSFEELASGTYYIIFRDNDDDYEVISTGEKPIAFSQLSITTTYSSSTSGIYNNLSTGNYYESSGTATTSLEQATIENIELPTLTNISGSGYMLLGRNAAATYVSLTVEKIWENIIDEVDAGTSVEFTLTGTIDSGNTTVSTDIFTLTQVTNTDGSTKGTVTAKSADTDNTFTFETIEVEGDNTKTSTSAMNGSTSVTAPSLTVFTSTDNNTNLSTITWTLGTISLQKASGTENITYNLTVKETETVVDSGNPNSITTQDLTGYVMTSTLIENNSTTLTARVTNTQILYELELYKISSSGAYLANAEFTLYTDKACTTEATASVSATSASDTSGSAAGVSGTNADSSYGKLTIGKLAQGTYYLKETVTPSGYELNQSVWEISISYDASDPTKPIIKVTQVVDENGNEITDDSGIFTSANDVGDPTTGSTTTVHWEAVSSSTTEYTISFEMENEIIYSMPSAGSVGIGWTTIGGIALMLFAIWMVLREKGGNYNATHNRK